MVKRNRAPEMFDMYSMYTYMDALWVLGYFHILTTSTGVGFLPSTVVLKPMENGRY